MLAALIRSLSFPGSGSVVSAPTTERSKQHGTVGDSETSVVQRPHRPQHSSRGSESNNSDVALEHWADPTRARGSHDAVHASAGQAGPDRRRALAPRARARWCEGGIPCVLAPLAAGALAYAKHRSGSIFVKHASSDDQPRHLLL